MKKKTFFNWSTGKDSAFALFKLLKDQRYSVEHLITTMSASHDRVTMHGLRKELFEQQVHSIGIPASTIELPQNPDMSTYGERMKNALQPLVEEGFQVSAFGDIFLEDLRNYRENQLSMLGLEAHFPLWKKNTTELLQEFLEEGFKTIIIAVNTNVMDSSFLGRVIDQDFLNDLPENVDLCGENGEFHTFCFDGPLFSQPILFEKGIIHEKTYPPFEKNQSPITIVYLDLCPVKKK
jgi:uncharacterized protein (TIGR00290 family)